MFFSPFDEVLHGVFIKKERGIFGGEKSGWFLAW